MISGFMSPETQQPGNQTGNAGGPDVYTLLAWLTVHWKKIAAVAVVIVVVGVAMAIIGYMQRQRELQASTELLNLRPTLSVQTNVPPPQPSALLQVASDFQGTDAARRAQFLAGAAHFENGNFAEAETLFSQFVREHSGSPWAAAAAYGQAAALEAQGKTNEAFSAYQQVATAYPNSAVIENARLALARIHEQRGQPEQALRIYNELAPAMPSVPMGMGLPEAAERRNALLRMHPELDTNQPANTFPASAPAVQIQPPAGTQPPITLQPVPAPESEQPAPAQEQPAPAPEE